MIDLFGKEVADEDPGPPRETLIKKNLGPYNYRPREETMKCCITCAHSLVITYSKSYYKCEILGLSHSVSTDIKAKHVCDKWEVKTKEKKR